MRIPKWAKNRFIVLLLILNSLLLASSTLAASYQEGIHLIRPDSQYISSSYSVPEYLTVEDMVFISCLEDDQALRNSLLCLDDNSFVDLPVVKWSNNDNCYLSSYNLEDFVCERLVLQGEYTKEGENYKLTRNVRVNKLSTVLDEIVQTQYSDGGWRDPLSTAYGVWALSYFKDIYDYELDLALEWLKLNRNEEKKCWPKSPCNVELSSNVLALLTLSNYTDARRVVNDARNWLEELQNAYSQGDDWQVVIQAVSDNTTLSLVSYDRTVLDTNFTIPTTGDKTKNYSFEAYTGKELIILSDDNIIANITNQEGKVLITYQGDNFSYDTPGPCWSLNIEGEPCDETTTMFNLFTPIDEDNKDLAKDWARSKVKRGDILGRYFNDQESVIDTSLYVYNIYDDDDGEEYMDLMIDWMLYTQNNEGSWDNGTIAQKVIPSAYAAMALFEAGFNRTAESIEDAEKWISDNEESIDANQTDALSSAFCILKHNARPLLVSDPKIITMDKPTLSIELFNPTTFNLEELSYEFSDEIKDYLTIEVKEEIGSYSFRKLKIKNTGGESSDKFGFLTISNLGDPVAQIPIILTDTPVLNISYASSITIFGSRGEVNVKAKKSDHEFTCSVDWTSDEINTPGSVRVRGNNFKIPIQFSDALTKEDVYEGTLRCSAAGKKTELPLSLFATRFAATPLEVSPTDIVVNQTGKNIFISLQNNLDQDIVVSVSIDRYADHFAFRNRVTLDPNEILNFTITNNLPNDLNLTSTVLLDFSVFNRTESVSVLVDVTAQVPTGPNFLRLIITLSIVAIVVVIVGFVLWKFRDVVFAELNKLTFWKLKTAKKKEVKRIHEIKETERQQAIVNLFNIMKMQNRDDKEIATRLLGSFSRQEIKDALLTVGAALPMIEEEEPEKA